MLNERTLYVEKVKVIDNQFISSEIILATEDMIQEFKSKPCNHDLRVDKLIYDIEGWPYDLRYCGVCETFLGGI